MYISEPYMRCRFITSNVGLIMKRTTTYLSLSYNVQTFKLVNILK